MTLIAKWTPFRLAQCLHALRQGSLNVGNTSQNRANLLALAIAQANSPSNPPWARWRIDSASRTSGSGLYINVPLVPGYTAPGTTPVAGSFLTDDAGVNVLTDDTGTNSLTPG